MGLVEDVLKALNFMGGHYDILLPFLGALFLFKIFFKVVRKKREAPKSH